MLTTIPVYEFELHREPVLNPYEPSMRHVGMYRLALVRESSVSIPGADNRIDNRQTAARVCRTIVGDYDREAVVVLTLNVKNLVTAASIISIGDLSSANVHPREVFKIAILDNASAIFVAHNHPSGDPTPSREDREIYGRLVAGGNLLGIRVLDFLVISEGGYYTLALESYGIY